MGPIGPKTVCVCKGVGLPSNFTKAPFWPLTFLDFRGL